MSKILSFLLQNMIENYGYCLATVQYGLVRSGTVWYGPEQLFNGLVRSGTVQNGLLRSGTVMYGSFTVGYGPERSVTVVYGHLR